MTLKQFLFRKGLRQIEVANTIGWCPSAFNKFLNGWLPLPAKYESKLCEELGITKEKLGELTQKTIQGDGSFNQDGDRK